MRVSLAVLLALALVAPSPVAEACGPFFPETIFIQRIHPDLPFEDYAAGKIGVVQPTYEDSFLVVAYRYFSARPFDAQEQKQLLALWKHEASNEPGGIFVAVDSGQIDWSGELKEIGYSPATDAALPAGSTFAGTSSPFVSYPNCLDDAFRTAANTLKARVQEFGKGSAAVTSWISAQESVFTNCGASRPGANAELPQAADPGLPLLIRQDRDYQTAAAYFYAGRWDEAEKRFQTIAADPSSPWRAIAALVSARCELRAATLSAEDAASEDSRLKAADEQLRKVIADPSFVTVRTAAKRLQGFAEIRLDPAKRFLDLSSAIEDRTSPETIAQDVSDYDLLLARSSETMTLSDTEWKATQEASDMTDWIATFKSGGVEEFPHALDRWHTTHSTPWLLAALSLAISESPDLSSLLESAAAVPLSSPAFLSAKFHRDRLLAAEGKTDQARAEVDLVLRTPKGRLPVSARNLFTALRMTLARNLDEFLRFAPREISVVSSEYTDNDMTDNAGCFFENCKTLSAEPLRFDVDAATALTEDLPTHLLADAAASSRLPVYLRRQVAEAAWTRAVLLDETEIAQQLVPTLSALSPRLEQGLKQYHSSESLSDKHFAAAYLILQWPELRPYISGGTGRLTSAGRIDSYRDNWWCALAPPSPGDLDQQRFGWGYQAYNYGAQNPLLSYFPIEKGSAPSLLAGGDKRTAQKEWTALQQLGCGPTWLGEQVLAWAKLHPDDPRVPEALHLVVHASRWGCNDGETGAYSKEAFELLHKRYPKNDWTAATPYWFN